MCLFKGVVLKQASVLLRVTDLLLRGEGKKSKSGRKMEHLDSGSISPQAHACFPVSRFLRVFMDLLM